jgi:1,4-dihydroxy-2-naphthoate phytyltransferase
MGILVIPTPARCVLISASSQQNQSPIKHIISTPSLLKTRSIGNPKFRCNAASTPGNPGDFKALREVLYPDGVIEPDGTVTKQAPRDPEELRRLWKAAIKAPMYSVGLAPVIVSAMAAWVDTGFLDPIRTLGFCLAAVAIIAWLNLSNDVFDSTTGVDKTKPESVVNLTGSRIKVLVVAVAFLFAGSGLLFSLLSTVPNVLVPKMLYAAICCGYLYQGPPFRWSYLGLGEPLCFLAFGPLATCAFYLAQIPPALATPAAGASALSVLPTSAIALSVLIGISTSVILFCSHFHQIAGDRANGKMSPLVRMGTKQGAATLKVTVGFTYALTLVLSLFGVLPFAVWTSSMVAYGFAAEMVKLAETNADDPEKLQTLKHVATKWHIGYTGMLALGLFVRQMMIV